MTLLAEISDKMPTLGEIIVIAIVASAVCAGLALINRAIACSMLALTCCIGDLFAYGALNEAILDKSMSEAIWSELGATWIIASVLGPLLPASCVAALLFFKSSQSKDHGFPIDPSPPALPL